MRGEQLALLAEGLERVAGDVEAEDLLLLLQPLAVGERRDVRQRWLAVVLLAVGRPVPAALQASVRALDPQLASSQVKSVFVARYLGDDGEAARAVMAQVWALLRPHLLDRPACPPRIWRT